MSKTSQVRLELGTDNFAGSLRQSIDDAISARVAMTVFKTPALAFGPPITEALLQQAEARLGLKLPSAYLDLLRERNGGYLERRCVRCSRPTSWAPDHVCITSLLGIGYPDGIDGAFGSEYLVREWSYPDIGVVLFTTPSAGHDTVMLDYRGTDLGDDAPVVYVDEDRSLLEVAPSFFELLRRLEPCDRFAAGV